MKIERTEIKNCRFDEIGYADVFIYDNQHTCLRLANEGEFNAIDLETGDLLWFDIYEEVEKVNATLVIE